MPRVLAYKNIRECKKNRMVSEINMKQKEFLRALNEGRNDFQDIVFEDLRIENKQIENCRFLNCTFVNNCYQEVTFKKCNFEWCFFSDTELGNHLIQCNFFDSIFQLTKFPISQSIKCKWANCEFYKSCLLNCYFKKQFSLFRNITEIILAENTIEHSIFNEGTCEYNGEPHQCTFTNIYIDHKKNRSKHEQT